MGYETDFITGRAINRQDKAVAVVIIQTTGGYPDAEKFAAKGPVYPNDRFQPLSLPLKGKLDERGYFTPDENQIALEIFESFIQMPWQRFRDEVLNNDEAKVTVGTHPLFKKTVVPGLAILHEETANALEIMAKKSDNKNDAEIATEIILDANERNDKGDSGFYFLSQMEDGLYDEYVTLSGKKLKAPNVINALTDGEPSVFGNIGRASIKDFVLRTKTPDQRKLKATFEVLASFQKMQYGMRVMRQYWQPSAFSRSDNLMVVAKFSVRTLDSSLKDLSMRNGFDPENERVVAQLDHLSDMLRKTLATVEAELELRNSRAPSP